MGERMNDLAINGGEKTVDIPGPHYTWPEINEDTEKAVVKQLHETISIYNKSGIIEDLENKFADLHKMKHSVLFSSGTSAIYAMFVASQLREGDEIICPAYTFYATISPIFFTGAVPVLVDCLEDGNIDPKEITKKITPKTKAIIVTHMWGKPCQMDKIVKIAKENNLLLLEDCSHAHFAKYKGKLVGTFGDISAFSLQGQKTLTGGEGGIFMTNKDDFYYNSLLFGHYNKRCRTEIPSEYPLSKFSTTGMGLKLRIHPVAAAIAYEQLNKIDKILEGRRKIAKIIIDGLKDLPGLKLPELNEEIFPSWYALIIQYNPEELGGLSKEEFYGALVAEGCEELDIPNSTGPLNYYPLFQDPAEIFPKYKDKLGYGSEDFPNATKFYDGALKLPVWHKEEDLEIVRKYIEAFKKVVNYYTHK